jgi:hypothetical protein
MARAAARGDSAAALEWLDYLTRENESIRDLNAAWTWELVTYLLKRVPELSWAELVRKSMAPWISTTAGDKNHNLARVLMKDGQTRLTVAARDFEFYLVKRDNQYVLSLGAPDAQRERWAAHYRQVRQSITSGDLSGANTWLDTQLGEERVVHDIYGDWGWSLISLMSRMWGEEHLGEVLTVTQQSEMSDRYGRSAQLTAEENVVMAAEGMRGHFSGPRRNGELAVTDEGDRYVLSFDACGSGGRMRRGDPILESGSRLEPPYNFVNISGAYAWTWNRKSVCGYCAHCAVGFQIIPIENMGYPIRMVEYPEDPQSPCRWIVYKRADLYPDEAYTAVGHSPERRPRR